MSEERLASARIRENLLKRREQLRKEAEQEAFRKANAPKHEPEPQRDVYQEVAETTESPFIEAVGIANDSPVRVTWEEMKNKKKTSVAHGWVPRDVTLTKDGFISAEEWEASHEIDVECNLDDRVKLISATETPGVRRMGGKFKLVEYLMSVFPQDTHAYVECFFGSGRVFLSKPWKNPVEIVNDADSLLLHFYRYAIFDPRRLCDWVNSIPKIEAVILGLRQDLGNNALTGLEKAGAYYICSSTAYNAVVRNELGKYASSPHLRHSHLLNMEKLQGFSSRMQGVDIRSTTCWRVLDQTIKRVKGKKIFFYLDPPYDDTTGYEDMSRGTGALTFGKNEQRRLSEYCWMIHQSGNSFIQTNSNTEFLRKLYGGYKNPDGKPAFYMTVVNVRYTVGGGSEQSDFEELVISNFKIAKQGGQRLQEDLFTGRTK
jgi:DNA adenine methylase